MLTEVLLQTPPLKVKKFNNMFYSGQDCLNQNQQKAKILLV